MDEKCNHVRLKVFTLCAPLFAMPLSPPLNPCAEQRPQLRAFAIRQAARRPPRSTSGSIPQLPSQKQADKLAERNHAAVPHWVAGVRVCAVEGCTITLPRHETLTPPLHSAQHAKKSKFSLESTAGTGAESARGPAGLFWPGLVMSGNTNSWKKLGQERDIAAIKCGRSSTPAPHHARA